MIGGRFLILIDMDDDYSALTTVAKMTGKLSNKLRKYLPNYNSATLEVSILRKKHNCAFQYEQYQDINCVIGLV